MTSFNRSNTATKVGGGSSERPSRVERPSFAVVPVVLCVAEQRLWWREGCGECEVHERKRVNCNREINRHFDVFHSCKMSLPAGDLSSHNDQS